METLTTTPTAEARLAFLLPSDVVTTFRHLFPDEECDRLRSSLESAIGQKDGLSFPATSAQRSGLMSLVAAIITSKQETVDELRRRLTSTSEDYIALSQRYVRLNEAGDDLAAQLGDYKALQLEFYNNELLLKIEQDTVARLKAELAARPSINPPELDAVLKRTGMSLEQVLSHAALLKARADANSQILQKMRDWKP